LEVKVEHPLGDGALIEIGPFALRFHKRSEGSVVGGAEERVEVAGPEGVAKATVLLAPVSPARLVVTTPGGTTETTLRGAALTLGRDAASDIAVDSDAVSRRHARLDRRDSGWEITDLGSTNGLRFQGKSIQNMPLANGDVVYSPGAMGVVKTADRGVHWAAVNSGIRIASIPTISSSPWNPHAVYVEVTNNAVFQSQSAGDTWTRCDDFLSCGAICGIGLAPGVGADVMWALEGAG
jgi:hypothetical protein